MKPFVSSTADYHRHHLNSLGWELTVCAMIEDPEGPCRRALGEDLSYGAHLSRLLARHLDWMRISRMLEIGGGYGFVMRDLLAAHPRVRATMLDISPHLLSRQRETVGAERAEFIEGDFFEFDKERLASYDLAILNEIIGDFPALCDIDAEALEGACEVAEVQTARRLFRHYGLELPEGPFVFNLGAALAVEKLCAAGVPAIFVSEHSCEAIAPPELAPFLAMDPPGFPERIGLKGHDEYTIKFSHLESVARALGYRSARGPYADFLHVRWTDEVRFILASRSARDEHEAVRQFIEDLYRYEYLILVKKG
ncbi:MAG TPA: class I SAM-dependent methyltransferase [Spirochaetota bacterium]|nr:class I SAM-dependent methyltransferase [Spirochaetota bacterium]